MSVVSEASKYLSRAYWTHGVGIAPAGAEVEVVRDGDDGWRVSLPDPEQSPFSLLGFITLAGDRFRVRSVEHPITEFETETLAEAIDALRPAPASSQGLLVA